MRIIKVLILCIVLLGGLWIGNAIPVSDQREMMETLRTIASIVFGVIGAWIALVYPRALEELLKRDGTVTSEEDNIKRLLRPLLYSTGVLAYTLAFDFVFLATKGLSLSPSSVIFLRRLSFCSVAGTTLLQLWALALTLGPTDAVRQELRRLRERREYLKSLRSRIGKDDP
jgi:uncharacterized membrane protein (DUF441 family)